MSKQVVRVASYGKGSLGAIGNEAERKAGVNHRNKDIDPEREHLNLDFKRTEHGFYAEWQDINKKLNAQFRDTKNATAFEGMVITAEAKFFEEKFGWVKGQETPPEMVDFWKQSYEWAIKEIGYKGTDQNVISAIVHMDETSPHMQLYYVPVTERWQEKVYAKDEEGKVLRNAKGSPVQLRDEKGKIVYRIVEDHEAPKLSRTEMWRVRGGQTSYSQMQDRYHKEVGQKYDLERGEVGSNKKHQTKHEWEMQQMKSEANEIREQIEDLQEDLNFGREEAANNQASVSICQDEAKQAKEEKTEAERGRDSAAAERAAEEAAAAEAKRQAEEAVKKKEEAEKKAAEAKQQAEESTQTVQKMRMEVNQLRYDKGNLEGHIRELERKESGLMTSMEVADLKGKRTLTGGLKDVTYTEYEALKRTAERVDDMTVELAQANARADSADQRVADAWAEANSQLRAARAQDEQELKAAKKAAYMEYSEKTSGVNRENQRLRREVDSLTGKVNRLEKTVEYLKAVIQEKLPELVKSVENRVKQLLSPSQTRGRGD